MTERVVTPAPTRPLRAPQELAEELKPVGQWLVALDFDGTLAPIVDHPDLAQPAPGALDALTELVRHAPVGVLTGRAIDDVRRRLDGLSAAYAGGHGAELVLADGTPAPLVDPELVAPTLDQAEQDVRAVVEDRSGWLVERKQTSLAIHHRLADEDSVLEFAPRVAALLERHVSASPGFQVLSGKAVLELRPVGADKGVALDRISATTPGTLPLVVGDDVTDEDAFEVARTLGGRGVLVAPEDRDSAATDRVADPDAVVALLTALVR